MKVKFLKAFNGDSIWISFLENGDARNIIIDGGVGDTYQNTLKKKGDLFDAVEYIKKSGENVDLLILTHFDDDHIGGLLRWLNNDMDASRLIKKVWFNSGKEISKELNLEENADLEILIDNSNDLNTSVVQGIKFEKYLRDYSLWDGEIIVQGREIECLGMKFKILSPSIDKLRDLLELYEKKEEYFTSAGEFDFSIQIKDFINEENQSKFKFKEDKSVANGSSIAFILEYQEKKFLFLGDAHPTAVIEGLKFFDIDENNKVDVELMKVSHHGSKHNTNTELLKIVVTDNYLISSNGTKHGLPNKRTIARIINNNPKANIHFNYEDLKGKVFLKDDFEEYEFFKISSTNEFDY